MTLRIRDVIEELQATADTLEACADAGIKLDDFEAMRLAVRMRDWSDALQAASSGASVTPFPRRFVPHLVGAPES